MDFVSDDLFDGRRFRALMIVDNCSCECPAIELGQGIRGERVVEILEYLKLVRGFPDTICVNNGSECVSKSDG